MFKFILGVVVTLAILNPDTTKEVFAKSVDLVTGSVESVNEFINKDDE